MYQALTRGTSSDCSNPVLEIFVQDADGRLVDPFRLSYAIFDVSDDAKLLAPVKRFPVVPDQTVDVNLVACPTGQRIGKGHYFAAFSASGTEPIGDHEVRWEVQLEDGGEVISLRQPFRIVSTPAGRWVRGYCTVDDLRAEGVRPRQATNARLMHMIAAQSEFVDRVTGQFFEPRYLTLNLNGRGTKSAETGVPVIAVEKVTIRDDLTGFQDGTTEADVVVFNRHLRGLFNPDDRRDPRIELRSRFSSLRWASGHPSALFPRGRQNIDVVGVFGFTDPDGSPAGTVPEAIRLVTMKLVIRNLPLLTDRIGLDDAQVHGRITQVTTRDQTVQVSRLSKISEITGDPEIDRVLVYYRRPIDIGATATPGGPY